MASADDLRGFLENLLKGYDPTIDLTTGSPAQTRIIDPVISRFSDDPFAVDITTFLRDRLVQEFPDLAADNGGQLEDLLTNPLQLFLEPFKREIETVKTNQSVRNANLMSDDEADALGANFFEDRSAGDTAGGTVRLYFAAPTTSSVTVDKRVYTNSNLNFYPVENFKISTAQMLFNREGNLYYMDIVVQAENPGDEYNVDIGDIANIDDVSGVVKVANLSKFSDGSPREDNETYLGRIPEALTERSLVTKRGIDARIPDIFTSVRALSIIGAGESGMDRDILKGTGQGFLHMSGLATSYGDWFLVSSIVYKDGGAFGDIVIQAGDVVRFKKTGSSTIYEAKVVTVVPATTLIGSSEYLLVLDTTWPITAPSNGSFALFKPGFITISEVPGGIAASQQVPDGTVHLGGHTDVFVRPNSDTEVQTSLPNITDDQPVLAIPGDALTNLNIAGTTLAPTNVISSSAIDFVAAGVREGDLVVLETTALAGSYRVLGVGDPNVNSLRLDTLFDQTATQIRARIIREVHIDLVEPKVPKLPFNTGSVSDLRTTVGSNLFRMDSINIQSFGAQIGDTLRVLDGPDAGDFTITGFDGILGGQGPLVDRAAGASGANLRYEVFTASTGLQLPLVRIKKLELLDSTNQGTGITIPYGDAVDVRPKCDFDGASETRVLDRQLFVFPDMTTTWPMGNAAVTPGANHDARYSQEIESYDGFYRGVTTQNGANPITQNEVNVPPFLYNGKRTKLMAFTTRRDPNFTAYPAGNNRTSDLAEAKIGDSITILDGPNQGSYLITDHRVLSMWSVTDGGHHKIAILEVDPPLPADPVRTMMNFIAAVTPGSAFTAADAFKAIQYATDFFNVSGFWALLQTRLQAAMTALGITISNGDLDSLTRQLAFTGYSVGPSARGELRLYFQEPVSVELSYGQSPTRFVDLLQTSRVFRLDPNTLPAQILPESEVPTGPSAWNRNEGMEYYVTGGSPSPYLFLTSGTPFVKKDVKNGDIIEFHSAINDIPARDAMSSSWVCVTQAGSNVVTIILPAAPGHITPVEAGQLLFIDSGPDIGSYVITEVITDELTHGPGANPNRPVVQVRIDKVMTHSTEDVPADIDTNPSARPAMPADFSPGQATTVTGQSRLVHAQMGSLTIGDWVSIYATKDDTILQAGDDTAYLGTFKVIDNPGAYVVLDRTIPFPAVSPTTVSVYWIVHKAPTATPTDTSGGGKTLSDSYVRCRLYDAVPDERVVQIPWTSPGTPLVEHTTGAVGRKQIKLLDTSGNPDPLTQPSNFQGVVGQCFFSHKTPYRVTRAGIHRISSTAMAKNREGALYYMDVPAVGYGPSPQMNIPETTALAIKENAKIDGYTLVVENPIFTFSDQEQVSIVLPSTILPVGSTPGLDNEIGLAGQTVQVTYNNAPLTEELQRFFNSPLDRVVVANTLLRHFLPMYVFVDAAYVGGSDTSVVATDIIDYINNIPPDVNQLRVDKIQDLIKRRSATQVTLPITVIALVHDTLRKIRGLRSQNAIGAGDVPIFAGTYAQSYFISGPDASTDSPRPDGEQVFLTRT